MIRLYRQTPEGIERTTQVDAAEQHLDSVFWIDLLTPEPAEIKFVERLCGLEMPTPAATGEVTNPKTTGTVPARLALATLR